MTRKTAVDKKRQLWTRTDNVVEEMPRMKKLHIHSYRHPEPANSTSDHRKDQEQFHFPARSFLK